MKKSSAYWQKRFQAVEEMHNQAAKGTVQAVTPAFDQAQAQIEKEINAWYARFAKNNNISMAEAKRLLNTRELKEFRWDVEEYIKHGRQNAIDQQWMKQLENASARFHISRLEALKIRTQNAAEKAFGNELDQLDDMAARTYMDGYYHTAYEIQRGLGIGFDVSQIDDRKLKNVLSKPWTADKMTFSDRIWKSKTQLVDALHTELTRMCILGKAPDQSISAIARKMNVSKGQAGRLVMTEAAYFGSAAQRDCFNDLEVEFFEIIATLDNKTSEICQEMDGKVFPMSEYQIGSTAPPFHVWCRSCTAPWFDDNDDGTRAARDEDGITYYVPASMKYDDWKAYFVDKTMDPEEFLKFASVGDIKEAAEGVEEVRKAIELKPDMFPPSFTATKAEAKNTQALMDYVNACEGADPDVVELYSKMRKMENIESQGIPFSVKHNKNSAVKTWHYQSNGKMAEAQISYPKLTGDDFTGQVQTTLHEQMHLMDLYLRKDPSYSSGWFSSEQSDFMKIFTDITDPNDIKMSDTVKKLFADYKKEYDAISDRLRKEYRAKQTALSDQYWKTHEINAAQYKKALKKAESDYYESMDYQHRNAAKGLNNLQDIYDALSGGKFRDNGKVIHGHGSGYYRDMESRCHETLANYGALSIANPDLIKLLREDYPELVDELEKTVKKMLKKVGD